MTISRSCTTGSGGSTSRRCRKSGGCSRRTARAHSRARCRPWTWRTAPRCARSSRRSRRRPVSRCSRPTGSTRSRSATVRRAMRFRGRSSATIITHFCACCFPRACARRGTTSKTSCARCSTRGCRRTASCSTRRWRPTCSMPRPEAMTCRALRRRISARSCRMRRASGRCSRCCTKKWTHRPCCRSTRTLSCRCARCWHAWSRRVFWSTARRCTTSASALQAASSSSSRASGRSRASRSTSSRRSSLATFCSSGSCFRPGKRPRPAGARTPPCSTSCAASTRSSSRSSITARSQSSSPPMPMGCSRRSPSTGASIQTSR